MLVAKLVEWSIPTLEVRTSNRITGKIYFERLLSNILKDENNEKETGNFPFKTPEARVNDTPVFVDKTTSKKFNNYLKNLLLKEVSPRNRGKY